MSYDAGMAAGSALMGARKKSKSGNFIKGAIKHPGSLHAALNIPASQTIPAVRLAAAAASGNTNLKRKANLAKTLKGLG